MNGTTAFPATIDSFSGEHQYLSNFWDATVSLEGESYRSTEFAFQAAKTLDIEERRQIRMELSPGRAKRLGQKVKLRPDWDRIKDDVMLELVRQKFTRHPDLAVRLLSTGHATLVEGNRWRDTYWGVCDGVGENKLGQILMKVRGELRDLASEMELS